MAVLARRTALMPGHSALSMPTCAIRRTMKKGRPVGAWFNLQEASDFSDKRKSEIEAARRAGKLPKKITIRKRSTIEDLLDDWSKSVEFKALSSASQSSYRKCISAILYRPQSRESAAKMRAEIRAAKLLGVAEPVRELEAIATATPTSIGKPEFRAFYNYAKSARGHHMALSMIATLSAAFTWGQESVLWRLGPNPREGMEFDHPEDASYRLRCPNFPRGSQQPMRSTGLRSGTASIWRCSRGNARLIV